MRRPLVLTALLLLPASLPAQPAAPREAPELARLSRDFRALSDRVTPAVVQILTAGYVASEGGLVRQHAGGSGVILDPDGYVVTNAHVVQGARRVQVALSGTSGGPPEARSVLKAPGRVLGAVVVGTDGKVMENARQLEVNLYPRAPGTSVNLEVLRGAEKRTFVVTVAERPGDPARFADRVNPDKNAIERLGILGLDLDDEELAALLPSLRARAGVLVAASDPRAGAGLRPGDVIYSVNQQSVKGVESLRQALGGLASGAPLVLQIEREGELRYVLMEPEP